MALDSNSIGVYAGLTGAIVNIFIAFFTYLSARAARKAAEAAQKSAENDLLPYTENYLNQFTDLYMRYQDVTKKYGRAINMMFETGGPVDLFDNYAKKTARWPRHILYEELEKVVKENIR